LRTLSGSTIVVIMQEDARLQQPDKDEPDTADAGKELRQGAGQPREDGEAQRERREEEDRLGREQRDEADRLRDQQRHTGEAQRERREEEDRRGRQQREEQDRKRR
jgi:hypothetical protein